MSSPRPIAAAVAATPPRKSRRCEKDFDSDIFKSFPFRWSDNAWPQIKYYPASASQPEKRQK
jgi:hypothetical protein